MNPFLAFLHASTRRNAIDWVVRHARRPGIGLVLVVLLSLFFAVVAQAQTDNGESGSGDGDKGPGVTPRQIFPLPVPSNVTVIGSNYDTIVVSWEITEDYGHPESLRYQLESSTNNSNWIAYAAVTSKTASATRLTCGTLYYVRVKAGGYGHVFPDRFGNPSGSATGRTIPCPPPAPSGFSGTAMDAVISASWSPVNNGVGISRYNFGIRKGSFWYSRSVGTSTTRKSSD